VAVIGELIEWLRTTDDEAEIAEGRFDLGGGDLATCVDYQPSGHDSQPMPGDFALLAPGPESGSYLVAGWVDPNNAGVTKPGEARLYARDGEGAVVGALHVTADGNVPDGIAAELIARADRADAALNALAEKFNAHIHITTAMEGSGPTVGTISPVTPAEAQSTTHAVGCDKVYGT
jgi:hypothetical protein